MDVAFSNSWVLGTLLLGLIPLFRANQKTLSYPWLEIVPTDSLSLIIDWLGRGVAALAIAALIAAISGPHFRERSVERLGTGAHIVLVLDRSASMNANFAGHYVDDGIRKWKGAIAKNLLAEFVSRRPHDLFAMVSFSTSPIYVLPLTQNHTAVQAAIRSSANGKGLTNMAPALAMALEFFTEKKVTGSRIILLVSDGATILKPEIRETLKQLFHQNQVRLYWIYLRTPNGPTLDQAPKNPNERTTPEFFIHQFFQSLGVPYRAFQAGNPDTVKQAIEQIEQLENMPILFLEKIPKQDLSIYCYMIALTCLVVMFLLKILETRKWAS